MATGGRSRTTSEILEEMLQFQQEFHHEHFRWEANNQQVYRVIAERLEKCEKRLTTINSILMFYFILSLTGVLAMFLLR